MKSEASCFFSRIGHAGIFRRIPAHRLTERPKVLGAIGIESVRPNAEEAWSVIDFRWLAILAISTAYWFPRQLWPPRRRLPLPPRWT